MLMKQRMLLVVLSLVAVLDGMAVYYYHPPLKIYDDTLFVASSDGIYAYDLKEKDAELKPYAFEGLKMIHFAKSGARMLVAGMLDNTFVLLRSFDYGKTFENITPDDAVQQGSGCYHSIYQMSDNPEHIYVVYSYKTNTKWFDYNRMVESYDFGEHWNNAMKTCPYDGLLAIDPSNSEHFIVYNRNTHVNCPCSFILETKDNFSSLANVPFVIEGERPSTPGERFYNVIFCPSNPQILLAATNWGILKSTDMGLTWKQNPALSNMNWHDGSKLLMDPNNLQRVYAIRYESHGGNFYSWRIYRSEDSGDTWQLFYEPEIENSGNGFDTTIYGNELINVDNNLEITRIPLGDSPTSVSTLKHGNGEKGNNAHDLQGRRLDGQPTSKGIYIQNGKKVVVK